VSTAVVALSLPMAAFALLGPWRRRLLGPMGVVGALTACVLAGDVMTGSHLMLSSLMGVQPVIAGRFTIRALVAAGRPAAQPLSACCASGTLWSWVPRRRALG
jgi:hypothetical protein